MNTPLRDTYADVERAMQRYHEALDRYLHSLKSEGTDARLLERMTAGTKAMKDSSSIYLSYAKFVAYGMPESEEDVEGDDTKDA